MCFLLMHSCHCAQVLTSRCTRQRILIYIVLLSQPLSVKTRNNLHHGHRMSLIRSISTRWYRSNGDVSHGAGCRWARPSSTRTAGSNAGNTVGGTASPAPRAAPGTGSRDAGTSERVCWRRRQVSGEHEQDIDIDIEMDIESGQLGEFDQEPKHCVEEPRRVRRRELLRESLRMCLRVQVCLRESLRGSFQVWLRTCLQVCLHAERECWVMALVNQFRVDKCDCKRMRVQIAHTSVDLNKANTSADSASSTTPWARTTELRCGKPRTLTTDAAKVKKFELWRSEKCNLRIKPWEAREIQLEPSVGAKRGFLSTWVAWLKHERNDVLRDCLFPQCYTNPGVSPLRRRTERVVGVGCCWCGVGVG